MRIHATQVDGFEHVVRLECAGTIAFLAIHSLVRGRAFGGIRIREYPSEEDALRDALALALAMSRKAVLADIQGGGAKTVMICPEPAQRRPALLALARAIEALEGRYRAGGDYGFTPADARVVGSATRYLATGDLDDSTAAGVEASLCALGVPQRVALQGLGRVGLPLARRLVARGIRVIAADPRPPSDLPAQVELVDPGSIASVECEVFAPCAHGGLLDRPTIDRLRCGLVCGAANNPFAAESDATHLHRRGIAYVPDFIANAGGLIQGASADLDEASMIEARMAALPVLTRTVLERATAEDRSPHHVAIELADERLAQRRDRPRSWPSRPLLPHHAPA